jgi:hypothetical protein
MDLDSWLTAAIADARRRGLPELAPLLETMARSTAALRKADEDARREDEAATAPPKDPDR